MSATGRRPGWVAAVSVAALAIGLAPGLSAGTDAAAVPRHTAGYSLPPANGRFDYQIGGAYRPAAGVRIVDRDRTASPAPGVYDVCYVNAFQTQDYQASWWKRHHRGLLLHDRGRLVEEPG